MVASFHSFPAHAKRYYRITLVAALCCLFFAIPAMSHAADTPAARKAAIGPNGLLECYDGVRNRDLDEWKRDISSYSLRHYGIESWKLEPTAIVLHYTAGSTFPLNLIESREFKDEAPGVASHFVIDEENGVGVAYQLLPLDVMSRATFGANFCAISIEMVAIDENDLLGKRALLDRAIVLVRELMARYGIPVSRVYGHSEIDRLLAEDPHGEFFDNTIEGAFVPRKVDPGNAVMALVHEALSEGDPAATAP
jgi:N-acetyl-anhydromuramyl-L-alanine amidase AmpD